MNKEGPCFFGGMFDVCNDMQGDLMHNPEAENLLPQSKKAGEKQSLMVSTLIDSMWGSPCSTVAVKLLCFLALFDRAAKRCYKA